jgi:hypothetical protein
MRPASIAAILTDAKALLAESDYQTRFIAALDTGERETYRDPYGTRRERPRWVSVAPTTPGAMLSLRGAIYVAAGSGPVAWEVFDAMSGMGFGFREEPGCKGYAIRLLDECIAALTRRQTRRRVLTAPSNGGSRVA